jgi:hypothetical protein
MEFGEKAKIRIEHWMKHTTDHIQEYTKFAEELEQFGHNDAAKPIRDMTEITAQCKKYMKDALSLLK